MNASPSWSGIAFAVFLILDGIACLIPIKKVSDGLDAVNCPPTLRRVIPFIKFAAAAGLVIGLWQTWLGLVTAVCLVVYFAIAVGFHVRAKDTIANSAPAVVLLILAALLPLTYR